MKAILLLSGGIDSPVAGYLMKQRGVKLIALHFVMRPEYDKKIIDLAKKIGAEKFIIVNYMELQREYAANCNPRYQCLFCKRTMLRIAEKIAEKEKADMLVTGESLGQVASQTLTNLTVLDKAVKIEVARPLLGFDKEETMRIGRDIGTYEISICVQCDCNFLPKHPSTQAKLEKVEHEESKLDMVSMLKRALASLKTIKLK